MSSHLAPIHPQPESAATARTERLADRLTSVQASTFTGRRKQLDALRSLLDPASDAGRSIRILYVHGPVGIGKTALLGRYAALAEEAGRPTLRIDGAQTAADELRAQAEQSKALPRTVALVDNVDGQPELMPALAEMIADILPADAIIVLTAERAPDPLWLEEAGWHRVVQDLSLDPLEPQEAEKALDAMGLPADLRPVVAEFSQGHPLALTLGAVAARAGQFSDGEVPQQLVLHLLDRIIGTVPGPAYRTALEVSAHSRWTTEDLLRSVLGEDQPTAQIFDWLRRLPFVTSERHGLSPCPLVRALLDADVRWRDPSGYRDIHQRIRKHVLTEIRHSPAEAMVHATLALTYLHRSNGFVSRFVTWQARPGIVEVPYRPELREALLQFVSDTSGSSAAEAATHWLLTQPRAFRLYWDVKRQQPVGALAWLHLDDSSQQDILMDPLAAAAWQHSHRTRPLRPHERLALARLYGPSSLHTEPSPLLDLMLHRVLATFIVQDSVAWSYLSLASPTFLDPLMRYIDQHPVPDPVAVDGTSFTLYAHDWRAVTVERWMEVGHLVELAGPDARPTARPQTGAGSLAVLTREQFDTAVSDALAAWHRKDLLARNPLTHSRMISERGASDPAESLREVLAEALDTLGGDPRLERYHRAVVTGLLRGAPTREAAAERMGLPLSTFRRHLARGVQEIRAYLWNAETRGSATASGQPGMLRDSS